MLKILLKIWPALVPIILYLLWIFLIKPHLQKRRGKIIDASYSEINQQKKAGTPENQASAGSNDFSLHNPIFLAALYLSLIMIILSFLFFAIYGT